MLLQFDATTVQPNDQATYRFELGHYPLEIIAATLLPVNNDPNSGRLEVEFKVFDGTMKGATIKRNYNLFNQSEKAKTIAKSQFSALCHAIDRKHISDTNQLIGGRCLGLCGPQDNNEQYSEVKSIMDLGGNTPGSAPAQNTGWQQPQSAQPANTGWQQPQTSSQPAQAAPATAKAPWE